MRVIGWVAGLAMLFVLTAVGWTFYTCFSVPRNILLGALSAEILSDEYTVPLLDPLARHVLWWRVEHQQSFQDSNYAPNSAIGVAVAMFEDYPQHLNAERRLIQLMQKRGADINAYDCSGYTPLLGAVLANRPESVSLLLRMGANPALPVRPRTGCEGLPKARPMRSYEGLDALAFARWFAANGKKPHEQVTAVLLAASSKSQ